MYKFDTMSDHEIDRIERALNVEIAKRGAVLAEKIGISISTKPGDFNDHEVVLLTPLGEVLILSDGSDSGILLGDTCVSEWVFMWVHQHGDKGIEQWVEAVEDREHIDDAKDVLNNPSRVLGEGARLYEKWEPLLRLMLAESIQEQ